MNMQAMMAQPRKLQRDLEKTTEEINSTAFTYENDNILVECMGDNKISKVVDEQINSNVIQFVKRMVYTEGTVIESDTVFCTRVFS